MMRVAAAGGSAARNTLELSVSLLGPSLAIYGADIIVRRNCYDGRAMHDESPTSPFWYHNGVNWCGVTAQIFGTSLALFCVNTTIFIGPVAGALGGADLSCLVGPLVGSASYTLLTLLTRRQPATATTTHAVAATPATFAA
jgi:NCS1 family nucleobase:cation symporter-1